MYFIVDKRLNFTIQGQEQFATIHSSKQITFFNFPTVDLILFSGSNFFQFLEGEKQKILELFSKIEKDTRHHSLIKFIEKPVFLCSFSGYMGDFITDNSRYSDYKIQIYLNHIKILDPSARKAVMRLIEPIII